MGKDKRNIWSLIFFVINILVISTILIIQLNSEGGVSSINELAEMDFKWKFILCGILCFLVTNLISALKLNIYHKNLEKKSRFGLCLKTQMLGKYYTKITPFGLGGQPFEVYYFNKYRVKATNSLTMVSCSYVSNQLMYGLLALVMICTFRLNHLLEFDKGSTNLVLILAFISFGILAIFLTFAILLCVNKKLGHKLVAGIIKLLTKIRLVKNPANVYLKIMRPTLVFQKKMKKFFASKGRTIIFMILSLLEYIIEYSVPFFVYSAFNGLDFNIYWQLLSISIIIELACRFIPLPGGSGMAELSFYAIFASLFDAGVLFWALLIWRIITYYNYLFVGLGIIVYDYMYGRIKLKKLRNMNKRF